MFVILPISRIVLYTFRCVSDRVGRATTGTELSAFRDALTERHRTFMTGRPQMTPGQFKDKTNYVAGIEFVTPQAVEGTLRRALEPVNALPPGFVRAVYLMVVIAEIHPFLDGNGGQIDAIVQVLDLCWRWTHSVPWSSPEAADLYIHSTNAFEDSSVAAAAGVQLQIF